MTRSAFLSAKSRSATALPEVTSGSEKSGAWVPSASMVEGVADILEWELRSSECASARTAKTSRQSIVPLSPIGSMLKQAGTDETNPPQAGDRRDASLRTLAGRSLFLAGPIDLS